MNTPPDRRVVKFKSVDEHAVHQDGVAQRQLRWHANYGIIAAAQGGETGAGGARKIEPADAYAMPRIEEMWF